MPHVLCPGCQSEIPAEQVNITTDLALCKNCGEVFRASAILAAAVQIPEPASPPADTRIQIENNVNQFVVRFPPTGFQWPLIFLIAFAVGWWSFLAAFCGMGITKAGLFLCLFMTPFFVAGIAMLFGILWPIFGRVTITLAAAQIAARAIGARFAFAAPRVLRNIFCASRDVAM